MQDELLMAEHQWMGKMRPAPCKSSQEIDMPSTVDCLHKRIMVDIAKEKLTGNQQSATQACKGSWQMLLSTHWMARNDCSTAAVDTVAALVMASLSMLFPIWMPHLQINGRHCNDRSSRSFNGSIDIKSLLVQQRCCCINITSKATFKHQSFDMFCCVMCDIVDVSTFLPMPNSAAN